LASPLAKKVASERNIVLSTVSGSGPRGRIVVKDLDPRDGAVETDLLPLDSSPKSRPNIQQSLVEKSVPVSRMRSLIAKRLSESKSTIPHFYLQREIDAAPLRLAREAINRKLSANHSPTSTLPKVSLNDIILKACAECIPLVPEINTSWGEDHIQYHSYVNLAFGVAVDDGLVTPVIKNANLKNLIDISNEAKSLIDQARSKKIRPDDMSGSTFTVTNLGMFGVDFFSGIINPPNAAILSVGASIKKVVPLDSAQVGVGERMILGLSCDHRLIDGATGASFLKFLAETLECPATLLV